MKLLIVSRRFPPDVFSGTETVISHVYEHARVAEGVDVRLVAGWVSDPSLLPDGARKVRLAGLPKPAAWAAMAKAARSEIRAFRPDVVLANSIESPASLAPSVTIVYDFNFGSSRKLLTARLRGRFYRHQAKRLQRVVVISEATRRAAIDQGFPPDKLVVIYPGVDVHAFRPADDPPAPPGDDGPVVLAYPSRIIPGKGQHAAIEAFRQLPRPWRDRAELQIVGGAPDAEYLARLRQEAQGLAVSFHTDVPEIIPYYQRAHVVLFPTLMEEGFGYTAAEGMACGRPVVHFSCAAVDEACAGHAVGVPSGDTAAMAGAVAALLGDPERCQSMSRAGRRHVVDRFSWEAVWSSYRRLLQDVAGRGGPAR